MTETLMPVGPRYLYYMNDIFIKQTQLETIIILCQGKKFSVFVEYLEQQIQKGMFIETLDDVLNKQNSLENNMKVTRYMHANFHATRSEFKSMKNIQNKKRLISQKSPIAAELLTCKATSQSAGISGKTVDIQNALLAQRQVLQIEVGNKKIVKEGSSNLLRDTFGNFRIYKSYATSTKSNFQISSEKSSIDSPMILNLCRPAPLLICKSEKVEKRMHANSQSVRPMRRTMPQRVEKNINNSEIETDNKKPPSINSQQNKLPTLQSKPSLASTQVLDKHSLNNVLPSAIKTAAKKIKGYLHYDSDCLTILKNKTPLQKKQRFMKCRKIPILTLTADRVCVVDSQNLELIYSDSPKDQQPIEIASLTKVVTALLSILICRKYDVDYRTFRCRVSQEAAFMPGTSAQLQVGDSLTVEELLYALMLPSGNDAAVALADNLGRVIIKNKKRPCKVPTTKVFISHMNTLYRQVIGDNSAVTNSDTQSQALVHLFQNPSGLSLNPNTTTPQLITLFGAVAYRCDVIKQIVATKTYDVTIKNQRYGLQRRVTWTNTNKLLWKGWEGIKTGTTENAGPCLLAKNANYIVGLFNCGGQTKRFTQAALLVQMVKKAIQ